MNPVLQVHYSPGATSLLGLQLGWSEGMRPVAAPTGQPSQRTVSPGAFSGHFVERGYESFSCGYFGVPVKELYGLSHEQIEEE